MPINSLKTFFKIKYIPFVLVLLTVLAVGTVDIPPVAAQSCGGSLYNVSSETELNDAIACVNAAGPGTYTIVLTANIFLTGPTTPINNVDADEIIIDDDIIAAGKRRAIDGQSNGRIFAIEANTTVRINGLGLASGYTLDGRGNEGIGGAIRNFGELTLTDVIIVGNQAFSRGGGIYNGGVMKIINSRVGVNLVTYQGAGIFNDGELTLIGSTVYLNRTPSPGGGITNSSFGTLNIINSTISGNIATRGAGIDNQGPLNLINTTIAANEATESGGTGGLNHASGHPVTIINSLIADQIAGSDCSGTIITNGHNLDSDGSCLPSPTTGDIPNGNADLLFLTFYPPGNTQTHALGPNSDAIDAGNNTVCNNPPVNGVDQRGVSRPQGGVCDIGAFELEQDNQPPQINEQNFDVDENSSNGTSVGMVVASDPDTGDSLSFAINAGNTNGAFNINSSTGEITVANSAALDFETTPIFSLTVQVTDGGGLSDVATVTISLNNVNESPDISVDQTSITVLEAQTATNSGSVIDVDGDTVTLTASIGMVTNNNDGTWSWSFTTSDGPSESQPVTIFADDGNSGPSQTTFDLIVNNVNPTVEAGPDATIIEGETFSGSGSFTDPGADTWTATVDYGDGSDVQSLALNPDKTFDLTHTYPIAGSYTVIVTVTDDDGVGTDTLTVFVQTPAEAIQDLIDTVEELNLQNGIDNSLDAKLESAKQALEDMNDNNDAAAINSLQAFINAVEAQRDKALTNEEADMLIEMAQRSISSLS